MLHHDKLKGRNIVRVGLGLGFLQAIATLIGGGGLMYFTIIGAIIGLIGMIIVGVSNDMGRRAKMGAYVGAGIFLLVIMISFMQLAYAAQLQNGFVELDEEVDSSHSFEVKREKTVEILRETYDGIFMMLVLLALGIGLMAVGALSHILFAGNTPKKAAIISVLMLAGAVAAAILITNSVMGDHYETIDAIENSDSSGEVEMHASSITAEDIQAMLLGSRIAGAINVVNLLIAAVTMGAVNPVDYKRSSGRKKAHDRSAPYRSDPRDRYGPPGGDTRYDERGRDRYDDRRGPYDKQYRDDRYERRGPPDQRDERYGPGYGDGRPPPRRPPGRRYDRYDGGPGRYGPPREDRAPGGRRDGYDRPYQGRPGRYDDAPVWDQEEPSATFERGPNVEWDRPGGPEFEVERQSSDEASWDDGFDDFDRTEPRKKRPPKDDWDGEMPGWNDFE